MQIKAVDDKKDLFQVNGLFTDILLDNLSKEILEGFTTICEKRIDVKKHI